MRATGRLLALAPLVAAWILLPAAPGTRADVRVDDSGGPEPELAIRLSPAGPWSLVRPFDATVLNPSGDAYGDGLPDDAAQGERLLAAWVRPGEGRVHLSRWSDTAWTPLIPFAARGALGVPRVHALGDGWAVTWQQGGEVPIIRAGGVGHDGGHFESQPLIRGWLIDQRWLGELQLVLHHDEIRSRLLITGVLWSVPGVPSPVDIVFVTELDVMLPGSGDRLPTPQFAPAPHPGKGLDQPLKGAWARRAVVTWWSPTGEPHQSMINVEGEQRAFGKPRFDLDVDATFAARGSGAP